MVKIKICGITNLADGRAAIDAGADMLGLNFYKPSPRYLTPDAARELINDLKSFRAVEMVGVFVNETIESVIDIAMLTGIDTVQLHGDESPWFCEEINTRDGLKVIKAVRTREEFIPQDAQQYPVHAIILMRFIVACAAALARQLIPRLRATRSSCLAFPGRPVSGQRRRRYTKVEPHAVDACSLLESTPGKDAARSGVCGGRAQRLDLL